MNHDTFYVTRYMGAKYKLLDFIVPELLAISNEEQPLVDLMAGTHAVGYALKSRRRIIANDIQYYSKIFGMALIENNSISNLRNRWEKDFEHLELSKFHESWFVLKYANSYFSYNQCLQIAAIRERIKLIPDELVQTCYLTSLAYAMSLCQSSSGHFAQYLPSSNPRTKSLREMDLFQSFKDKCLEFEIRFSQFENRIYNLESSIFQEKLIQESLAGPGSTVYLDPPYSPAQYSRYYHLLETVFLDDNPEISFKGLYRENRFQSDFCSPRLAPSAFEKILNRSRQASWNLVISYASSGIVNPTTLLNLCQKYYPNAYIKGKNYSHSTQGRGETRTVDELLVVCQNIKN